MNKIIRYIVLTGIFIIPFIPLVVTNSLFFPFITGKNFAFRIIVELIFAGWTILALTQGSYRPKKSWIMWTLAAFVIIIGIADTFGIYPYKSFWSNYERMEGFVGLIHLALYTLVVATVLNTNRLWVWFWNTSIGVSILMAFYGLFQLAGWVTINQGGVRLDARLGNATYLAVYMLFHIFLTAYLMVSRTMFLGTPYDAKIRPTKIIIGVVVILLQALILYHTATRGAMLGLIGGMFITAFLIVILEKEERIIKNISIGIIIAAIVIVGGFMAIRNTAFVKSSPVLNRFATISLSDTTTKSRFVLWNMAYKGFKEHPILGWGQENFNYVFNKYYDPVLYNQEQWFDRTHNVIFDWLIAGGILGLAAYLSLYVSVLWYLWRKPSTFTIVEKSILTGLLIGYFIHNLFVFDNLTSYIMFFSVVGYVYMRTEPEEEIEYVYTENRIVAPMALVVVLLAIYIVNIRPIEAGTTLISAISPHQDANVTQNLSEFKKVFAYNTFGSPEAREQLLNIAQEANNSQTPVVGVEDFVAYADTQGKVQIARTPQDARYYALYGSFLSRIGRYDDALPQFKKALELSPNKQSLLFEEGSVYAAKNDYAHATEVFKQAFDAAPQNDQARILYASSLIYEGKNADAAEVMKPLSQDTIVNSDYILQAYYNAKQYQKVLEIWKARSAANPDSAQIHLSLAASYMLVNDKINAIAEIKKAIQLEPTFTEQGNQYIRQIQSGKQLQ